MRINRRIPLHVLKLPLFAAVWVTSTSMNRAAESWTLERALVFASTNNPDVRLAEQRIAAARAGIEQANSALWPQLQVQSSYIRTDNPMLVFGSILNQRSVPP